MIVRALLILAFLSAALIVMAWSMRGIRKATQDEMKMSADWIARENRRMDREDPEGRSK